MKLRITLTLAALAVAGSAFAQEARRRRPAPTPEMQAARQAMRHACAADMNTYCDAKHGREAKMCMPENNDKLSATCKDAMAKMPARRPPPPPAG